MKYITILIVCILLGSSQSALAFWGNDSREKGSGLDFAAGYDANTVTTLQGKVVIPPATREGSQHTEMTITTGQGNVTIMLGPWSYWQRQEFPVAKDQEISITGSRAVGKDGATYLFAQKLEIMGYGNRSITLRSESGVPAWSRAASGGRNGGGAGYGGGMRGGGKR